MKLGLVFLSVSMVVLSGCSTYSVNRYAISVDNVTKLRTLSGTQISVGEFSSPEPGKKEIMCRGVGPIKTPDGESFEQFVRKALIDELRMADVYSDKGDITLTGNLDAIDFSSASGSWNISLTVNSSNGNSISVAEDYAYTTSFYGETACNQTAQALMPAVQNLIGSLVSNTQFKQLITTEISKNN